MQHVQNLPFLKNILATVSMDAAGQGAYLPKRYLYQQMQDKGSYILPMKQSVMKDARLMPGTRCMIALLSGWAGKGQDLKTTKSVIAKHLGRSPRQVFRYLKDAARAGYLTYNYTKNRIGAIVGIQVFLKFALLRPNLKKPAKKPRNTDRTLESNTNTYLKDSYNIDKELEKKLEQFRKTMSFSPT